MENKLVEKKVSFSSTINSPNYLVSIRQTLNNENDVKSFIADTITVVNTNWQLSKCTPISIIGGALMARALNLTLSPALGLAYLVPYGDKAQFQIGYKGYIQLANRSGYYKNINARPVRSQEYQGRHELTGDPVIKFSRDEDLNDPISGYMAFYMMHNGSYHVEYMTHEEMEKHRDRYSKAYRNKGDTNLWRDDFIGMALKTVLRRLIGRWGVISVDLQKAIVSDMAVLDDKGNPEYVDNPLNEGFGEPNEKEVGKAQNKLIEKQKEAEAVAKKVVEKVEVKQEPKKVVAGNVPFDTTIKSDDNDDESDKDERLGFDDGDVDLFGHSF